MTPSRKERLIGEMIASMNRGPAKQPYELIGAADVQTPATTPDDSIERQIPFKLELVNKRPAVAGFFICPEYEVAIRVLASIHPSLNNNRGKALEYLVEFYIVNLPEEKRDEFLRLMVGALKA